MSVAINVKNANKFYGDTQVIKNLSVEIKNGEFFTLLGPSGCGKTTLLRMIAGFNSIEGGEFYFNDRLINTVDPAKRNIGMVFQNYAIFPNLTVRKNVEFGLKYRKMDPTIAQQKAEEYLKLVQVIDHAEKMPDQLSGGQQQRVALARALVIQPEVLLMDEPLSNLDAKLRVEMRSAIKRIQNEVGITTVYVTHDQEEAMAVSDRIAVMNQGIILQCASPQEIYQRPVDLFVANFIGKSNQLGGTIVSKDDKIGIKLGNESVIYFTEAKGNVGQEVIVSVRPEEFKLSPTLSSDTTISGTVIDSIFLGINTHYTIKLETGEEIEVIEESDLGFVYKKNDCVGIKINTRKANVFDKNTSQSLMNVVKYGDDYAS